MSTFTNNQYATPSELNAILGDKWSICRNTPANRERYGRCITRQQYLAATEEALSRRVSSKQSV
jgi:hypothetical protein